MILEKNEGRGTLLLKDLLPPQDVSELDRAGRLYDTALHFCRLIARHDLPTSPPEVSLKTGTLEFRPDAGEIDAVYSQLGRVVEGASRMEAMIHQLKSAAVEHSDSLPFVPSSISVSIPTAAARRDTDDD